MGTPGQPPYGFSRRKKGILFQTAEIFMICHSETSDYEEMELLCHTKHMDHIVS